MPMMGAIWLPAWPRDEGEDGAVTPHTDGSFDDTIFPALREMPLIIEFWVMPSFLGSYLLRLRKDAVGVGNILFPVARIWKKSEAAILTAPGCGQEDPVSNCCIAQPWGGIINIIEGSRAWWRLRVGGAAIGSVGFRRFIFWGPEIAVTMGLRMSRF